MGFWYNYRRPAYVPPVIGTTLSEEEKQKFINDSLTNTGSTRPGGIPDALSLERIIAGDVCPPCTVRDFMNYLKYIEHAPENLQFYMWYRDYIKRFEQLSESDQKLSPKWPLVPTKPSTAPPKAYLPKKFISNEIQSLFKGTDFDDNIAIVAAVAEPANPFDDPPPTPATESSGPSSFFNTKHMSGSDLPDGVPRHDAVAGHAFRDAGLKWQPFTVQPFRDEISRIISLYIAEDSPRMLNLSGRERKAVLRGLTQTTHPTAFRPIITNIEWSLRCQAHPNFIRWTICNGNRPRVIFARGLGAFGILAGLTTGILMTLSSMGRAWRVLALIGLMIGISTLFAAWKGMCVVLHGMHHRHLRPWELFHDDIFEEEDPLADSRRNSIEKKPSYEDEPWVIKYDKRNIIRKIFDREVWIEEPALRQIQDTIFYQALGSAFILSVAIVGVFVAVPSGQMY